MIRLAIYLSVGVLLHILVMGSQFDFGNAWTWLWLLGWPLALFVWFWALILIVFVICLVVIGIMALAGKL